MVFTKLILKTPSWLTMFIQFDHKLQLDHHFLQAQPPKENQLELNRQVPNESVG